MRASGTKRTAKRTDAESDVPTASEQNASEAMRLNGQDRSGEAPKKDSKAEQMSFWDYAESLGDQWLSGDLKAYVYRVWPRIDTQQDKVYLSIVQEPPTEEFLLRSYGSGRDLV